MSHPIFGVAGYPPNYMKSKYRTKREKIFEWLNDINLDWVELQNTYGVKMKDEQAHMYRTLAEKNGIGISLHGPYFISLASPKPDVVERSRERVLQCFHLASKIGAKRIIFHPGYGGGKTDSDRRKGIDQIVRELNSIKNDIPPNIYIYPETAGKCGQLGSVDEIIEICERVDYARPCIDLAHVHGFTNGSLWNTESIVNIFHRIENQLGKEVLNDLHIHMYPVAYNHLGESKHKAFADSVLPEDWVAEYQDYPDGYYPRAEHFIDAIKIAGISPVVICEAHDTQDVGATLMKQLYFGLN